MHSEIQNSQSEIPGLVSFLCLCYNHSTYIKECLESILSQNLPAFEIIVLDDGSSDKSLEIIDDFKKSHTCNIKVIQQKNSGNIGLNFNRLIFAAKGEYIAMISCDDCFVPNSLQTKIDAMQANKQISFICDASVIPVDEHGKQLEKFENTMIGNLEQLDALSAIELDFSNIHSYYIQGTVFRTEVLRHVGGYDEDTVCDDIILRTKIFRYLQNNVNLRFDVMNTPSCFYRLHGSNVSKNLLRQCRGLLEYYGRYWPDRKPPKKFLNLLQETALKYTSEDFLTLFVKDSYIAKLLQNMDSAMLFKESAVFRRRQGVPFLFEIETYSKYKTKIRILKILRFPIFRWEETLS